VVSQSTERTASERRRKRRQRFTDNKVADLKRKPIRYFEPDPELPGHGVRVLPEGPSSFYAIVRDPYRKQRWVRIGNTAELTIEDSRERARAVIKRVRAGLEPFEPPPTKPDTVADVAALWLKRHVVAKKLRTGDDMRRLLERLVLPVWRDRAFVDIKRSDVARLLDAIVDKHSPHIADATLSVVRAMSSWFAERNDDYTPIRGLKRRVPEHERKRSRILNDDELRAVWSAAEADKGPYGAFVRFALLTSQRRAKIITLRWNDISPDGTWTITTAPREKPNPGTLLLPKLALAIVRAQPRIHGSEFVFTGRDKGAISGFACRHEAFMDRCGVRDWSLHDLRRTARSLMARAGVPTEIAERMLGHARPAIEATYNLHDYAPEKADALSKLAALIESIVHRADPGATAAPPTDNVVPMRSTAVPL
jgi:integrase